jgi:hypothetical protein
MQVGLTGNQQVLSHYGASRFYSLASNHVYNYVNSLGFDVLTAAAMKNCLLGRYAM